MNLTPAELARLSAAGNILRPDWPERSLRAYLADKHGRRPYRDLAVALAWVAVDPATETPGRLEEDGPWWQAAATTAASVTPMPPRLCRVCRNPQCDGAAHVPRSRGDYQAGIAATRAALRNRGSA